MADPGNGCGKKHLGCHCVQCRAAYDAASGKPGGTSVRQAHIDEVNRRLKERGFAPGELQATMRGLRGDHLAPFTRDEIELGLLDALANMGGATVWVGDGSSCAAQIVEHQLKVASAEWQAKVEQAERWREALCDVLDLKNLLGDAIENIQIDRCPAHAKDEAGDEQHEPGEWVAWSAEYPEDGSVSLKMLASPPHIAQVQADEEAESRATAAESALAEAKQFHQEHDAVARQLADALASSAAVNGALLRLLIVATRSAGATATADAVREARALVPVTCEHCPDYPHPLDNDETPCKHPRPAAGPGVEAPIPMVLHCPVCSFQHVDAPEPEKGWANPPHRSHKCHRCGFIWRPADVTTNGVLRIGTRGRDDMDRPSDRLPWSPLAALVPAEPGVEAPEGRCGRLFPLYSEGVCNLDAGHVGPCACHPAPGEAKRDG